PARGRRRSCGRSRARSSSRSTSRSRHAPSSRTRRPRGRPPPPSARPRAPAASTTSIPAPSRRCTSRSSSSSRQPMAEQFLSQDEVDALLVGVSGEEPPAEEPQAAEGVMPYDLALQERIVRGRMPTLEIINDRFARNLRVGLFNFMRRNPEISVGPVKVQKYGAFLSNLVVPTNLNIMQVKPLRGSGLLILEPQLVFAVIDTLFGGSGRLQTRIEGREFSATEQRIIDRILEVVCKDYRDAWSGVYPLELEYVRSEVQTPFADIAKPSEIVVNSSFALANDRTGEVVCKDYRDAWSGVYPLELEYVRSEMQTQFANIATPSEIVVTTSFALEIGDTGGSMHLCIPYATLEPIRETLYSAVSADQSIVNKNWVSNLTR